MQGPRQKLNKNPPSSFTSSSNHVSFTNLAPQSPTEHYWASRAQKAEALLAAREKHFAEIGTVREEEAAKRTREIETLQNRYRQQYRNLERLVFVLIATVVLLVALLVYLAGTWKNAGRTTGSGVTISAMFRSFVGSIYRRGPKDYSSRRLNFHFHFPSHFTIPILSPWTSVTEHQTSHTSNTGGNSTIFYLLISLLLLTILTIIIWRNSRSERASHDKISQGSESALRSASGIQHLYQLFLSGLPFLNLWHWTWSWGYKILLLLGIISS